MKDSVLIDTCVRVVRERDKLLAACRKLVEYDNLAPPGKPDLAFNGASDRLLEDAISLARSALEYVDDE